MKKVCFITTLSLTIKSFLIDYAHYLVKKGNFDVTFICKKDNSMYEYCEDRIHYIPININRGISFDGISVIMQLRKIFILNHFDIIQYSTPNAAFYSSIAARLAKCKKRLYCQWGIRYMGFEKGLKRIFFKVIEKVTCQNSTYIECESNSILQFSRKEGLVDSKNSFVTWNGSACGVNLSKFNIVYKEKWNNEIRKKLSIPKDAVVFGFCGRLTKDKGINELLEAFKKIKNKKAYLVLIGSIDTDNSLNSSLISWAQECENIIFVEWTNELEKFYGVMDVFVSLSYREGFGLVVIEAAAMGLPAIVSNVPGQLDTINNNIDGWLVNIDNVEEIVKVIEWCLDNKEKLGQYGLAARKKVEEKYEQNELFVNVQNLLMNN